MRTLIFACLGILFAAVSAPQLIATYLPDIKRGLRADAAPAEATQDNSSASAGERTSRRGSPTQVVIEAERDGHFYVEAEINRERIRLMVDTGASALALRESDAVAAGIHLRGADFTRPVYTANGTAFAAEANIDSVTIDDIEVRGVRALILPDDQLSISLLGGSFLQRLARFEVQAGTLIIEN